MVKYYLYSKFTLLPFRLIVEILTKSSYYPHDSLQLNLVKRYFGYFILDKTRKPFLINNYYFLDEEILGNKNLLKRINQLNNSVLHPNNLSVFNMNNFSFSMVKNLKLIKLRIHETKKVDSEEEEFPSSLKVLKIEYVNFSGKNLPKKLQKLKISKTHSFNFDRIPEKLQVLRVHFNDKFTGKLIPSKIVRLFVWDCPNWEEKTLLRLTKLKFLGLISVNFVGNDLPQNIEKFVVCDSEFFRGEKLPQSIKSLVVEKCSNFIGNNLPTSLKFLKVEDCNNFIGDKLPKNLLKMISGCKNYQKD